MAFAELLTRTHYSFLRGASRPEELAQQAAQLGYEAIGVVDWGGVYGVPKTWNALRDYPQTRLLVGAELPIEALGTVNLLARTRDAYRVLCHLITESHAHVGKGECLISEQAFYRIMNEPGANQLVLIPNPDNELFPYQDWLQRYPSQLAHPLRRLLDGKDEARTRFAKYLHTRFSIPIFATNDALFHQRERKRLHDVLTATRLHTTVQNAGYELLSNAERYLRPIKELQRLYQDWPETIQNALNISRSCTFRLEELKYTYPHEWFPANTTADEFLRLKVFEGLSIRYPDGASQAVLDQLETELKIIKKLRFADYFLTLWDLVQFARSRGILCQGRGSAANSVVCYLLQITAIDPVQMKMLFERFISAERGEPPDIDVDFEADRREEVIRYLYDKYGRDRAAMVSAVITYQRRLAANEVKKALGLESSTQSTQHSRGHPRHFRPSFSEGARAGLETQNPREAQDAIENLADSLCEELKGFPRHLSIHSGGFVLSHEPLIDLVPIEPARMKGRSVVQWDKYDLDFLGLMKVDILSLGILTAINKTFESVSHLNLACIPHDDPKTYEMISLGDTVGVFQIESRAQMSMLPRLQPKNFYDLTIEVALVRPGPIVGQMVHPYLRRRRGQETVEMPHPALEDILGRTLGVPLFQEQVMKMAIVLAQFSPGEADQLRRAIGAWRASGSLEKMGLKLKKGLIQSGLSAHYVDLILKQVQGFAEYGFPESHAASFALLAYATAYLKCHYPAQYVCALLNSQPMGFYSAHTLIDDAQRHGVRFHPICIHHSTWDHLLEPGSSHPAVRVGMRLIQGLSRNEFELLAEERKKSPFTDLNDAFRRLNLKPSTWEQLANADAFKAFSLSRREVLWAVYAHLAEATLLKGTQTLQAPNLPQLSLFEEVEADYKNTRISLRAHPMEALRKQSKKLPKFRTQEIKTLAHHSLATTTGMLIVLQRPGTAKGTVFATLEDESGFLDLIFHPEVYSKSKDVLNHTSLVQVQGKVQRDGNAVSLLVKSVKALSG